MVDLTERKAAEEALKASEARYRALVENAPVCIHEIDRYGRISSMNPRGMQIAGAPRVDPVIGRRYLDLIHPDDQPLVAERMAAAMAGERVEMEFRGFGEDGYFFSTKIPIRNDRGEVEKLIGVVIDITERREQETAIRQARETLEDAIESLPDGFALWDADDRLITCNTRFREYNPLVTDVLQPGVTWREFMCAAVRRGQFAGFVDGNGDIEKWVDELRGELDAEGRTREFHDATGRWFRVIASRTRQGGLVGVRSDITEFKQMEDALRDSEALVRQVLEACPMPVLMTRLNGEIIYESPAGRQLFGRNLTDSVDSTLPAWADLAAREDYVARLREHGVVDEYEAQLRRPDGTLFPGAISARLIDFRGEQVIVSSTRDLTESRAVEREMQRQREALYQGEKLSAMGQLLASVAHELNNPLSVVVGQSLLLQETAKDPGVIERAGKIGNAADRCARIVKTFLAMARQQPVEMGSVRLNEVVETALEVTGYALRSHEIDVVQEMAGDLPPAWADADQLNQVLTNLIVNAQQALETQPLPRRIKIRTGYEPESKQLLLELSDNGPGMPPEIRSRIFEPFFTTKDKGSGTGIGLAVSHRILATHGGTINCDSTPGRGTTFTIRLPASPPESARPATRPERSEHAGQLEILVVDDEPDVADVIAELLRTDGHRVEVVDSGQVALQRLASRRYDLVLSDIRMPGLDGPALYNKLTESNPDMTGRIAFVTGDSLSPKVKQFLEATDCPRLEKPVTLAELRELVDGFTAGRH
jgi:PAS domain S-box-containing protein